MEDDDDEEMADYGTDLSDDVDSLSSPLSTQTLTTAVDTRHLGNRIPDSPDFPIFLGNRGNRRFPIPDSAGIGKQGIPDSRFGRNRESGSRFGGPGISWSGLCPIRALRYSEHAHLLSDIEKLTLPILGSLFPFWSPTGDSVCRLEPTST